jgi:hypothetical protein
MSEQARSMVCSIGYHDRCDGYAPNESNYPCSCRCHGAPPPDTSWVDRLIRDNADVVNRLDPHMGCVVCRGPLTDGVCLAAGSHDG